MTEQTDAAEVARAMTEAVMYLGDWETQTSEEIGAELAHVLSDWLAAREAAAEARGAERALREAADALEGGLGVFGIPQTLYDTRVWLRARAAAAGGAR